MDDDRSSEYGLLKLENVKCDSGYQFGKIMHWNSSGSSIQKGINDIAVGSSRSNEPMSLDKCLILFIFRYTLPQTQLLLLCFVKMIEFKWNIIRRISSEELIQDKLLSSDYQMD